MYPGSGHCQPPEEGIEAVLDAAGVVVLAEGVDLAAWAAAACSAAFFAAAAA